MKRFGWTLLLTAVLVCLLWTGAGASGELPVQLTLESAVEFINDDELVEITPKTIRLRKVWLKEFERRRAARAERDEMTL